MKMMFKKGNQTMEQNTTKEMADVTEKIMSLCGWTLWKTLGDK